MIAERITVKRLYSKYSHQLDIKDDEKDPVDPATWAKVNIPKRFRSRRASDNKTTSLYCNSAEFNLLMAKYKSRVTSIRRPLDADCEQMILAGYDISIRENLWYAKFRYSVQFYLPTHENALDLDDWITNTYGTNRKNQDYKFRRSRYFPTLYCVDSWMIDLIKLSEPAKVVNISKVCTFNEVAAAIR